LGLLLTAAGLPLVCFCLLEEREDFPLIRKIMPRTVEKDIYPPVLF
jgi:hypothetical protein